MAAQTNNLGLRLRLEAADAHFERALRLATDELARLDRHKPGDVSLAAFAAAVAAEVDHLLGRPARTSETFYTKFGP